MIEILLRNADIPLPPATSTVSTTASIAVRSIPTRLPTKHRQKRLLSEYCTDAAAIPSKMAVMKQSSSSLCADFTASYMSHTANMSYPVLTAVSQWLMEFSAVTASYRDLGFTSRECASVVNWATGWTRVTADVGCTTSVTALTSPCTGSGTMYITGFQLTSTILPVCGVTTSYLLEQTTQERSSGPASVSLLVPTTPSKEATSSSGVATSKVLDPTSQPRSTDPTTEPTPASVVGSVLGLPTVTVPASTATPSQAPKSSPDPAPASSSPAKQGTTIIGIQTEGSKTVVTEVVGTQTIVREEQKISTAGNVQSVTQVISGSTVVVPLVVATGLAGSSTMITEVVNGKTVITELQVTAPAPSKTTVTAVVNGQTIVTELQVTAPAPSKTTVTAVINGQTTVTEMQVTGPASSKTAITTVVNGQTIVTEVYKTVVTAVVSGKTIVTEVVNTGPAVSRTLITEVVSGKTIITEVGITQPVSVATTANALAESSAAIYTTTTQYISVVTKTGTDGKLTSFSAVVVQTMIATSTPITTTRTATQTSATRPPQPTLNLSSSEEVVRGSFTTASYFAAQYLPPLVAVIIKAMWEMVFAAIKLIQPFERMNHAEGAAAKYSVFAQYLSTSLSFDVFRSLSHGNFIPLAAAFALVLVQIGTPLASAAMSVKASDICIIDGQERWCAPVWVVNKPMLRSVEASLGACMLLAIFLAILMRRFRSGIPSDPSSFGALALLMNHEQLHRDIQRVPPDTDNNIFEDALEHHQFFLGYQKTAEGTAKYGIIASKEGEASNSNLPSRNGYNYHAVANPGLETIVPEIVLNPNSDVSSQYSTHSNSYTRTSILTRARNALVTDMLGLASTTILLALLLTYYLDNNDDAFNTFFNSGTVLPKFLVVGLATIASLQMSHIERVIRITEPFRRLAANTRHTSHVPNETTLLISRSGTPYSNLPQSITLLVSHELHGGRMTFQTLIALTAVLSDLNIIAVSGVVFSEAQTLAVYQGSCISSIALTSAIFLMWLVVFFWWRNNKTVKIVRTTKSAGTIGGMMRYLGGGGKDVVDEVSRIAEEWDVRNSTGRFEGGDNGLKPCFGRFVGSDEKERWCIGFLRTEGERENVGMRERRQSGIF